MSPTPINDRRTFLRSGTAALAGLAVGSPLLAACRDADRAAAALPARQSVVSGPVREVRLVAGPVEVELAPGRVWRTWGYNGQYPGPEIRVREGERLRVTVENDLPGPTPRSTGTASPSRTRWTACRA